MSDTRRIEWRLVRPTTEQLKRLQEWLYQVAVEQPAKAAQEAKRAQMEIIPCA